MTTAATIAAELLLDAGGFSKGMKEATKQAETFDKKMQDIGSRMQKFGATMSLAVTVPILAFGKASVDAAVESEMAMTELETVIESTGGAAGVTADELAKMADELQGVTMFGDEAIMQGQAMLLTFTKIGEDVFPEATMAMLNMAQKFGSIEEASIQLGKALNDPIQGVSALRRVGVMLSDQQEQQIKDFMAVGDIASAQRVILQELETEFGGLAEAMGTTAAGQMAIFNNELDSLKEALGQAIIPTLVDFIKALTPIVQAIADAPPWVQKLIVVFLGLLALIGPLVGFAGTIVSMVGTLSSMGITLGGLSAAFASIGEDNTGTHIPAIVALLPVLALIAAAVVLVYMVRKNWDQLKTTLSQLWFIIKWGFSQAIEAIKKSFASGMTAMQSRVKPFVDFFKRAWQTLKQIHDGVFRFILTIAIRVFSTIVNAISKVVAAISKLKAAFASIKLPKALTPGSPTPFEIGLMGINEQMRLLATRAIPKMNAGLNIAPVGISDVGNNGGYGTYIDNRRFSAGVTPEALRMAMDNNNRSLARAIPRR